MALKILLVDPDEEWRADAASYLQGESYEVNVVNNGKSAQLALYNDKYFAVILNYDIQDYTGMQVLKFIKTNYPGQKLIMLFETEKTLKDEGYDESKLEKVGVSQFLCKPFEMSDLSMLLEGQQSLKELVDKMEVRDGVSEEEEVSCEDDKFTKVKISAFYSSKAVLFDIFIKLSSGRYIKILHSGDSFSKERIDKYKNEKNVEYLYFYNSDRRKYIQYTSHLTKKVLKNDNLPTVAKLQMVKNISEKYVEEIFSVGVKPLVIDQGREVCQNIYTVIEKNDDLYKILREYQDFDPNAFSHAYLVTLFSGCIIKQFEWQSQTTIETTAMACMFHDIGKIKLPKEFINLRPSEMTDDQVEQYRQHPILGAELVDGNRMINNAIKQIILQHHEAYDGSGFPYGVKGKKILTLANIVSLANDFVETIIDDNIKPVDALKKILTSQDKVSRYNSLILENFIKVFTEPDKLQRFSKKAS